MKKREKTHKIRSEREGITTDAIEIKRIRDCYGF